MISKWTDFFKVQRLITYRVSLRTDRLYLSPTIFVIQDEQILGDCEMLIQGVSGSEMERYCKNPAWLAFRCLDWEIGLVHLHGYIL